jgi:NAD+ diphosphatase
MIQDISPKRYLNGYVRRTPSACDIVLAYANNNALVVNDGGQLSFPTFAMLPEEYWQHADYAFSIDDTAFFVLHAEVDPAIGPFEAYTLQRLREFEPRWLGFAGVTGAQLSRWRAANRFCGKCGGAMAACETERAMVCTACENRIFPKITPAVIVAVTDGDKVLMIKPHNAPPDRYHLIAGFVEIGETLEQAVEREVLEEAGVHIKNICYYKSQPWSFSDSLMVGFTAELDGHNGLTPQLSEVADAKWFARDEMPPSTSTASIGSELTNNFREGKY